ncbi:MAG: hypothetical protein LBL18_06220 [Bacteroidales bacterium]|jgi:hypothetical protein|nr:hypothetical protein [Bacteroidales bacterium]
MGKTTVKQKQTNIPDTVYDVISADYDGAVFTVPNVERPAIIIIDSPNPGATFSQPVKFEQKSDLIPFRVIFNNSSTYQITYQMSFSNATNANFNFAMSNKTIFMDFMLYKQKMMRMQGTAV